MSIAVDAFSNFMIPLAEAQKLFFSFHYFYSKFFVSFLLCYLKKCFYKTLLSSCYIFCCIYFNKSFGLNFPFVIFVPIVLSNLDVYFWWVTWNKCLKHPIFKIDIIFINWKKIFCFQRNSHTNLFNTDYSNSNV